MINKILYLILITGLCQPFFCLSPQSNLKITEKENQELLSCILQSEEFYLQKKKEAFDRMPDWVKSSNRCFKEVKKNNQRRLFATLSELTVPPLLNNKEGQEIREYISKNYCIDQLENPRKIVVVGAGPIGLIVSIELALSGHHVTVIEKRPQYTRDRLFTSFHEHAYPFLKYFLPDSLKEKYNQEEMCIKHVEEALKCVLEGVQVINPHVLLRLGTFKDARYKEKGLSVVYTDSGFEKKLEADCLIGCDGAHSQVRLVAQKNGFYTGVRYESDEDDKSSEDINEDLITDTVYLRVSNDKLSKESKRKLGNEAPLYQDKDWAFVYSIKDGIKHFQVGNHSLISFKHKDTSQWRFIPLSLYTEYKPPLPNYYHVKKKSQKEHRIYLFGESLSVFELGGSFYKNLSIFYRVLPILSASLLEDDWDLLDLLYQEDENQVISMNTMEGVHEKDLLIYRLIWNLIYTKGPLSVQLVQEYIKKVYHSRLKNDFIEIFLQMCLKQDRQDLINIFAFEIAHFYLKEVTLHGRRNVILHMIQNNTFKNCEVGKPYCPLFVKMKETIKTGWGESTPEEINGIYKEFQQVFERVDVLMKSSQVLYFS